jgi:subtilase family serine protease
MKSRLLTIVVICVIGLMFLLPIRAASVVTLTPSDLRAAYDVNPLLQSGYTGKGVTVAIVNTGIDGTFYADIKEFNSNYGLPDSVISVVQPYGPSGTNQETPTSETTADADFVHAMAPDAKILLVLVGSVTALPSGFSYVIDNNASDIAVESPSAWYFGTGAANRAQSLSNEYAKSVAEKITLIAASNDFGSNNTYPDNFYTSPGFWTEYLPNVYMMPQYSPYVTAVGGTQLMVQSGTVESETGWSQSGGGPSNLFPEPSWQTGPGVPQNGFRDIPDIALDASCQTPYAYDWKSDTWTYFCGTSGAAPTFAGIVADIDQAAGGRVGFLNPTLYSLGSSDPSAYHDITSGCSLLQPSPNANTTVTGYCAHAGWDFVTGWGSVDATKLAKHLAPIATVVPEFPVGTTALLTMTLLATLLIARRKRVRA